MWILKACTAAGSLFGIVIAPRLVGSAAEEETGVATPLTSLLGTAIALNCSQNGSDVGCAIGLDSSSTRATTRVTTRPTWIATAGVADELLTQVNISTVSPKSLHDPSSRIRTIRILVFERYARIQRILASRIRKCSEGVKQRRLIINQSIQVYFRQHGP